MKWFFQFIKPSAHKNFAGYQWHMFLKVSKLR